jgi:hypothetical protein
MSGIQWFIHEWRTGWNQGAVNRAEARLAALGEKPHRPGDCAACPPAPVPTRQSTSLDLLALWVATFGVWPLADPGHAADTWLSVFDIALHVTACVVLIARWKLVRR